METFLVGMAILGIATLSMAWMPSVSKKIKVSYSIFYVIAGFLLYSFLDGLALPHPLYKQEFTLHLTELAVIVALMGTGLKIDHRFSFKTWRIPFNLIFITMISSMILVVVVGIFLLGLDLASSVLLAAVLTPTDPVLAADVQEGPPMEERTVETKFNLTAEAGLNDGMAFPFVWLAITIALIGTGEEVSFEHWFFYDVLYRVSIGCLSGFLFGKAVAYLIFRLPKKFSFFESMDGFIAISTTLMVYAITELFHGYGFFAVFVAAIVIRNFEVEHKQYEVLHSFTDQAERILLVIVLILFGGSIANGLLDNLSWELALFGIGFIFVIRPLTGLFAFIGNKKHRDEKWATSFFGIKGVGSFFYLAFSLEETNFESTPEIWSTVAFVVLLSIFVHGATAPWVMEKISRNPSQLND